MSNDKRKTATCYECGKGFESKEDYDNRHFGVFDDDAEYHEDCCPVCYPRKGDEQ